MLRVRPRRRGRAAPSRAAHDTVLGTSAPLPLDVEVGTTIDLRAQVSCPSGCDLRGRTIAVTAPDGTVTTHPLAEHAFTLTETGELTIAVPPVAGTYAWTLRLVRDDGAVPAHDERTVTLTTHARPHRTSAAVWDVPSPVAMGGTFTLKVGLTCAAGCCLTGQVVTVHDAGGRVIGLGRLGDHVWPGTAGLYWAEVEVTSPSAAGAVECVARFDGGTLRLDHAGASAPFGLVADRPPQHHVTIVVHGEDTGAPIDGADVRIGAYRAVTDASGVARVALPAGAFELQIWSNGYERGPMPLAVTADLVVEVTARRTATDAEQDAELERCEARSWG